MSAFIVRDLTINKILYQLKTDRDGDYLRIIIKEQTGIDIADNNCIEQFGRALLLLNIQAVNDRYDDGNEGTDALKQYNYSLTTDLISTNKMQALKSLRCLIYQCSEGNVPETDLYKLLNEISHVWAMNIVNELPEYNATAWD